jgi:hypothetical protein
MGQIFTIIPYRSNFQGIDCIRQYLSHMDNLCRIVIIRSVKNYVLQKYFINMKQVLLFIQGWQIEVSSFKMRLISKVLDRIKLNFIFKVYTFQSLIPVNLVQIYGCVLLLHVKMSYRALRMWHAPVVVTLYSIIFTKRDLNWFKIICSVMSIMPSIYPESKKSQKIKSGRMAGQLSGDK